MTYISRLKTLMGLCLTVVLAACGGGGGGDAGGGGGGGVSRPQASVTASAESVALGASVTFDGAGSSTPNAGTLSYQWTLAQVPDGSAAALADAGSVQATLTPDKIGVYAVSLVVADGTASSDSVTVNVTVTAPPQPVAVIAPVQVILPGSTVQLDGSGSQPPAGGDASRLGYAWTLVEVPVGSTAKLDDATLPQPRFASDKEGSYKVRLVVSHGELVSEPAELTIQALTVAKPQSKPKATTASPVRGQPVQLDGRDSSHPEGKTLGYAWRFGTSAEFGAPWPTSGRPIGSNAVIDNPSSATPTFTPDVAGTYTLLLTVYHGKQIATASVAVAVAKPAGVANTQPVAVITGSAPSYTFEIERSISQISFDGSSSYDADGDALSNNAQWEWVSTPDGYDRAANSDLTSTRTSYGSWFKPTIEGTYVVRMRVNDGTGSDNSWSDWVTRSYAVRTGANVVPTAVIKTITGAKVSQQGGRILSATMGTGKQVTLDGSGSTGGNGDRVFYAWEMAARPDGSTAALSDTGATHPTFTPDKDGPYLILLRVTDAYGALSRGIAQMQMVSKDSNTAPMLRPTVNATDDQPILAAPADNPWGVLLAENSRMLISPNPLDSDGEDVDVLTSLVDVPAGFAFPEVKNWTSINAGTVGELGTVSQGFFRPTVTGTYTFSLVGTDGIDTTASHVVRVPVATLDDYPTLLFRRSWNVATHITFPAYVFQQMSPYKLTFPVAATPSVARTYAWRTRPESPDVGELYMYELRAGGQDYTIVDVKAESEDPLVPVAFAGLTEGQVIKKGTAVTFTTTVQRFPEDRTEASPATPYPKARWSFKIKEKPEWTFSSEVTLRGQWTR